MNTIRLNTIGTPCKAGGNSGGGGISINNQSKSVEFTKNGTSEVRYDAGYTGLEKVSIKVAIPTEEKAVNITENGTTEVVADNGFLSKVSVNVNVTTSGGGGGNTPSAPKWTGHADAEGLRAIGWTDEDIAYYQENGVNWNAEDDEYHKVTDDNKALYGVLTANNISTYKDRIVYLPKIDISGRTSVNALFDGCRALIAIPKLDTSNLEDMSYLFSDCSALSTIPLLDCSKVTDMNQMFSNCSSLVNIPKFDISSLSSCGKMFMGCSSLVSMPLEGLSIQTNLFKECYSLRIIQNIDASKTGTYTQVFLGNYSLCYVNIKNVRVSLDLSYSSLFSKDSLLYLINNEAATSAITIKLASYAYTRLAEDVDIVAALANHPNISISK